MGVIIYFLHHSGFIYENETSLLVFDFYKDTENRLETLLKDSTKKLYFFVSHYHADHFNRDIRKWEERAEAYIMHKNCWLTMDGEEKKHLMVPGDTLTIGDLTVTMYGSTDEGGSFLVKSEGKTIFHAGDLNWWHWAGEPAADNLAARRDFFDELSRFSERQVDVAFFPVDARQQAAREWGVMAYLERVEPKLLVAMHAFGKRWLPSYEFLWHYPEQKLWIPEKDGDVKETEA